MINIEKEYSLLKHNTFGIDVKAKLFIEYTTKDDLVRYLKKEEMKPPFLHIGSGSNLLFLRDYSGTILHSKIGHLSIVEEDDKELIIKVGSGYEWDDLVAYTVDRGWYGLENLSLIPGEVGSSAVQNIGAYGVEVKDYITQVDTVHLCGETRVFSNADCNYKYRYSIFKEPEYRDYFITDVYFKLSKIPHFNLEYGSLKRSLDLSSLTLQALRDVIIQIREEKLPNPELVGNAGSFFMNPVVSIVKFEALLSEYPNMPYFKLSTSEVKIPAGWLIDICGWKGKQLGNAGVHDKQALVLINRGGATGEEVLQLAKAIQKDVMDKFGIAIHPEVNFIEV